MQLSEMEEFEVAISRYANLFRRSNDGETDVSKQIDFSDVGEALGQQIRESRTFGKEGISNERVYSIVKQAAPGLRDGIIANFNLEQ